MELHVHNRAIFGKQTKHLRRDGFIPAELYGHQFKNIHLAVPAKTFIGLYREAGAFTVITLVTESGEKIPALIATVAQDPISREFLSIDFHHIRQDEQVKVKVPIDFTGTAPAVKSGFLVVTVLTELEVEALPTELPHRFTVDISTLANLGENIHVKDISLPKGVKTHVPSDTVVVTVSERRKEEVVETPAAAAEAAPAEGTPAPEEKTEA